MMLHLHLFRSSQESWPSEIVIKLSFILTINIYTMRGEARSRFSWHTQTYMYVCDNKLAKLGDANSEKNLKRVFKLSIFLFFAPARVSTEGMILSNQPAR